MAVRKGVEQARSQLPGLLRAAEKGRATIITKHGRPVAALVPIGEHVTTGRQQQSLLPLKGSGRGMWSEVSSATIRALRDEWSR